MAQRLQILTIFDAKQWDTSHQQYATWADFEQRCIESTNKELTYFDGTKYTPTVCDPANDLFTYGPMPRRSRNSVTRKSASGARCSSQFGLSLKR